ncbi:MAG: hypothetical protein IRY95_07330 [Clostridia bacterium]|nr:hypothetical protein [Clostridia bacterium]
MRDDQTRHGAPRQTDPRSELRAVARRLMEEHSRLLAGEDTDTAILREMS